MNKPSDHRPSIKPRRAEPIQPDVPGRGNGTAATPQEDQATGGDGASAVESDETRSALAKKTAERQQEQSQAALDNVRKGYR